eukprot:6441143-Amphidinium_carterae.1
MRGSLIAQHWLSIRCVAVCGIGSQSDAWQSGVSIGSQSDAWQFGLLGIGFKSDAWQSGVGIGSQSDAWHSGVGIGSQSDAWLRIASYGTQLQCRCSLSAQEKRHASLTCACAELGGSPAQASRRVTKHS